MMKWVLLNVIHFYWQLRFLRKRRTCLFKESCSHHVYRITHDSGFKAGVVALGYRISSCRPGYTFETDEEGKWVCCLKNGDKIPEALLSPSVLPTFSLNNHLTNYLNP